MVTAVFNLCDDVRKEANGQASLIGMYGRAVKVSGFPVKLGRMFAIIDIMGTADELRAPMGVRIDRPGHPPISRPPTRFPIPEDGAMESDERLTLKAIIELEPTEISQAGEISGWVILEDREILAGRVGVTLNEDEMDADPAAVLHFLSTYLGKVEAKLGAPFPELAAEMMRFISGQLPAVDAPNLTAEIPLSVYLGDGRLQAFFPHPVDNQAEIKIINRANGQWLDFRIVEFNRSTALLEVPEPSDGDDYDVLLDGETADAPPSSQA